MIVYRRLAVVAALAAALVSGGAVFCAIAAAPVDPPAPGAR